MINTTATVNEVVKLYFEAESGITDFTNVQVYTNGVLVNNPNVVIEGLYTPGLYAYTYIPTITGRTALLFNGSMIAYVDVVTKSVYTSLKNIEDEALGSWTWDKSLGELKLLRQDGTDLASFDVVDNQTSASRERTS